MERQAKRVVIFPGVQQKLAPSNPCLTQSPRRVIHVDEGTAERNMLPRLVEECLLEFRPVQVIVRLDECCDRVRVCDCEQQVDAEPVYEIFREFGAVYRDDRVEPAPGEGMREAERRLQMLEALRLNTPADADRSVADVQRKATHLAPSSKMSRARLLLPP